LSDLVCVKLVLQCYWQADSGMTVNYFMLNCGVVFSHPLYSLEPAPTNFLRFPNVKSNFRWRFHNVENLKKKVTHELNIHPVFVWWLFHATSRKKYVAFKGDYLEGKWKSVLFLFYVYLPHSINPRTVFPCIFIASFRRILVINVIFIYRVHLTA